MDEHIWRIYRYYNPIEDKSYIGQTTKNVNTRAGNGKRYQEGTKFRDAIDKYGWDVFEQSILRLCISQEEADYWERYFIDKYDSIESGYNTQSGGSGGCMLDKHHTEETKKRISEANSGENNPFYDNHMFVGENNPMYGKHHTEETKRKLSESLKGLLAGEKNPMYGRKGKMAPCYGRTGEKNPMHGMTGEKSPNYGKTWYNNGTINIYININTTEVPEGFKKGMLRRAK